MDLTVAFRMEKNSVLGPIAAPVSSPNQVMVVPSCEFGDFLVANGAKTVLFFPEAEELSPLSEVVCHLEAQAFLKVGFPSRVIGIGRPFDFPVSLNGGLGCLPELNGFAVQFS
jgi:hypothetical protein